MCTYNNSSLNFVHLRFPNEEVELIMEIDSKFDLAPKNVKQFANTQNPNYQLAVQHLLNVDAMAAISYVRIRW